MAEKFVHYSGNGSLFKNDNKTPDNNQPVYSGSITLPDGTEQEIAAWVKVGANGKFLSLKLSDPYVKPEEGEEGEEVKKEAVQSKPEKSEDDPDLPF
tara:strand:- start:1507 stop:1797 length:291 start_codon:yes stop_codon:yes gene_type:complete